MASNACDYLVTLRIIFYNFAKFFSFFLYLLFEENCFHYSPPSEVDSKASILKYAQVHYPDNVLLVLDTISTGLLRTVVDDLP